MQAGKGGNRQINHHLSFVACFIFGSLASQINQGSWLQPLRIFCSSTVCSSLLFTCRLDQNAPSVDLPVLISLLLHPHRKSLLPHTVVSYVNAIYSQLLMGAALPRYGYRFWSVYQVIGTESLDLAN